MERLKSENKMEKIKTVQKESKKLLKSKLMELERRQREKEKIS